MKYYGIRNINFLLNFIKFSKRLYSVKKNLLNIFNFYKIKI